MFIKSLFLYLILNIPASVMFSFLQYFEGASNIKWTKEAFENYSAEFDFNGKHEIAIFSASGKLMETIADIQFEDLPEKAQEFVFMNFSKSKVKDVKVHTSYDGNQTFSFSLSGGDYYFDTAGRQLMK